MTKQLVFYSELFECLYLITVIIVYKYNVAVTLINLFSISNVQLFELESK